MNCNLILIEIESVSFQYTVQNTKKVINKKLQLQSDLIFISMIDMISVCFNRAAIYSTIHRFFDGHQLEVQAFLS